MRAQMRADTRKCMQIHADTHTNTRMQICANPCRYTQICIRYTQIRATTRRYAQIGANAQIDANTRANTRRYAQIRVRTRKCGTMMLRSRRAHRAKRRKYTASSHEQMQKATCSSVRRHVPASLFMKTRFPFTYQTGLLFSIFVISISNDIGNEILILHCFATKIIR